MLLNRAAEIFRTYLKIIFLIGPHLVVIPAKAGIHVFQGVKWITRLRGGDGFSVKLLF